MRLGLAIPLLGVMLVSCGAADTAEIKESRSGDISAHEASGEPTDIVVEPPEAYFEAALEHRLEDMALGLAGGSMKILYVDFDGRTLRQGYGRGESFILCRSQATVPNSGISQADQEDILTQVQEYFNEAKVKIQVTAVEPSSGSYTTIVVGGSYGSLGCSESSGILGIAPLDGGNRNLNDIGFVFTRYYNSNFLVGTTIAHEAGHTFGLNHIENSDAIMHASHSRTIEGFAEGRIRGSSRNQNSPAVLRRDVGELAPGEIVQVDLGQGGGVSGGGNNPTPNPGNGNPIPPPGSGGTPTPNPAPNPGNGNPIPPMPNPPANPGGPGGGSGGGGNAGGGFLDWLADAFDAFKGIINNAGGLGNILNGLSGLGGLADLLGDLLGLQVAPSLAGGGTDLMLLMGHSQSGFGLASSGGLPDIAGQLGLDAGMDTHELLDRLAELEARVAQVKDPRLKSMMEAAILIGYGQIRNP